MLVREDGPCRLFQRLRVRIGFIYDEDAETDKEPAGVPDGFLGSVFGCLWCMTVWVAGLISIVYIIFPWLVWILALSGLAVIIHSAVGRLNHE